MSSIKFVFAIIFIFLRNGLVSSDAENLNQ